ncbi:expansin-B8 [Oryza glaberrima]|uniref:Expansin-like EG45 domain-containing protein n=2 Tax=Oryza TaxID=4527 RepID=A0A0D3FCN0_9ORYZ|nr:expansin-B8 [Oryza glaberrima]
MVSGDVGVVVYYLLLVLVVMQGCKGSSAVQGEGRWYNESEAIGGAAAWGNAKATWYGQPNGAGAADNGGACGFKKVNQYPFMGMTSCGNQPLYKGGKGCGSCYRVRCNRNPACSGNAQTVAITDMNYFPLSQYHFDLSGIAFGRLAKPGRADDLRRAGIIDVQFARVPCEFPGLKVGFHVEEGSSPVYLAVLVEYENGDGDVAQVDLKEAGAGGGRWTPMRESWGSVWRLDSNHRLRAPFSIRIRSDSGKTLVAPDVIPLNWTPNTFYRSFVQYSS